MSLQNLCSSFAIEESLAGADLVTLIRIGKSSRAISTASPKSRAGSTPALSAPKPGTLHLKPLRRRMKASQRRRSHNSFTAWRSRKPLPMPACSLGGARLSRTVSRPRAMAECSGDIAADRPVRVAFVAIEKSVAPARCLSNLSIACPIPIRRGTSGVSGARWNGESLAGH